MFNKKRNAARKQQRLEQRAQAENRAIADIAAAQAIADPAARLLKLAEIENHIATHVAAVAAAAGAYRGHAVVAGGALAAGGVLAVIVALPHLAMPAMILMGSSAFSLEIGGMAGQGAHDDRRVKAQMAEVADHLKKMAAFTQQVAEMKETLVRDQAEGISRSPFYERVLNLPGLSDAFAGAAAKQVAALKEELAAAKKAAGQEQAFVPPAVRDYERFKTLLNPKK